MTTKKVLLLSLMMFFAADTFAQSRRLNDLTARLATDAADFAESTYRGYSGSFRNDRNSVEAAMVAHQFSATAQLFNRMVNDRRSMQDILDGFRVVQDLSRSVERNNLQQNRWYGIQRTLTDISRELTYGGGNNEPIPGGGNSSGSFTWRGRVDADVRIIVRGGRAEIQTLGGNAYGDGTPSFSAALPARRVSVRLSVRKGRGEVFIEQQPSRENDFSAVVRIRDPKGGASDYEFELSW